MSWWGGNEVHRAYLASIRRFEAKYPHIKVKGEYTGWVGHLERLTTQIAGGTAPDVMQVNWNWLVLFSRDGRGFYDLNSSATPSTSHSSTAKRAPRARCKAISTLCPSR